MAGRGGGAEGVEEEVIQKAEKTLKYEIKYSKIVNTIFNIVR